MILQALGWMLEGIYVDGDLQEWVCIQQRAVLNLFVLFEYVFQNEISSCRKITVSFLSCIDELGSNASWCQRLLPLETALLSCCRQTLVLVRAWEARSRCSVCEGCVGWEGRAGG